MSRIYFSRRRDEFRGISKTRNRELTKLNLSIQYHRRMRKYKVLDVSIYYEGRAVTGWLNHIDLNRYVNLLLGSEGEEG